MFVLLQRQVSNCSRLGNGYGSLLLERRVNSIFCEVGDFWVIFDTYIETVQPLCDMFQEYFRLEFDVLRGVGGKYAGR